MGFYIRKSISVGPLRFNLSKSGVGLSAGVRGFRVGTGPRGNYVHMGRYGVYYRETLSPPRARNPAVHSNNAGPQIPAHTHEPLRDIDSSDVSEIRDSSSAALLNELDVKRQKWRLLPFVAAALLVTLLAGSRYAWPVWLLVLIAIVGAVGLYLAYQRDALEKTVVLFYELDPDMETVFAQLHNAANAMGASNGLWHIEASGAVRNRKYHAGAGSLVRRKGTFCRPTEPPFLKSNVAPIGVGVGRQTLYFFPDRVLVFDRNGVGAVSYERLDVEVSATRFVEDGRVPSDAKVVDRTWQFVNKKGGPDRRFKSNRELPVCLYDEVSLSSSTGLNEVIQLSRYGTAAGFAAALHTLGRSVPPEVRFREASPDVQP